MKGHPRSATPHLAFAAGVPGAASSNHDGIRAGRLRWGRRPCGGLVISARSIPPGCLMGRRTSWSRRLAVGPGIDRADSERDDEVRR